jgi:hypothetical protein
MSSHFASRKNTYGVAGENALLTHAGISFTPVVFLILPLSTVSEKLAGGIGFE